MSHHALHYVASVRAFIAVTFALLVLSIAGCGAPGWLAHGLAGGEKTVTVEAAYRGLEGQKVAVLVAADDTTRYYSPDAQAMVCRLVTANIAEHVDDVTCTNPREIVKFQRENQYWSTRRASKLIDRLDVDRLVLIDLVEFRTHAPGNAHQWQGLVTGNIAIHHAESDDPDNPGFYDTVTSRYPQDSRVGVVDLDVKGGSNDEQRAMEYEMAKVFAQHVGWRFYKHEETR